MDFMEKITELRAKKGQLLTQAQALVDEGKIEEANEFTSQMEAINTSIAGLEALAKASQLTTARSTAASPRTRARERTSPLPLWASSSRPSITSARTTWRTGASRRSTTRCWASTRAAAPTAALPSRPTSPV